MNGWIDVSIPVVPGRTPTWPGSPEPELHRRLSLDRGDPVTDSILRCSVHTGTHVDAPAHFIHGGATAESLSLDVLMGPCQVLEVTGTDVVGVDHLEDGRLGPEVDRLLLRTDNSPRWSEEFEPDFVGLTPQAAMWIADRGIRLLGTDYLSVQPFEGSDEVHRALLSAGVVILEGLCLEEVTSGAYELRCLPLRLVGAEAAPARACLRPLDGGRR